MNLLHTQVSTLLTKLARQTDSLRSARFNQTLRPVESVYSLRFRLEGSGHVGHSSMAFLSPFTNDRVNTFNNAKKKNDLLTFARNIGERLFIDQHCRGRSPEEHHSRVEMDGMERFSIG